MDVLVIVYLILSIIFVLKVTKYGPASKQFVWFGSVFLLVLSVLYVILFRHQWQAFPLLIGGNLSIIILSIQVLFQVKVGKAVRRTVSVLSVILIISSILAGFIFPSYAVPVPTGDYYVGTESFTLTDSSRLERYTDDQTDIRRFNIQLWYPTDSQNGELMPWLEGGTPVSRSLARDNYVPSFMLDHMVDTMSNSYLEAELSDTEDQYPIVIISHGWRGFKNLHTDLAEDLASRGYIVISIDHTYGSVATVFDDEVAYLNLDALPPRDVNPNFLDDANQLVNTYAGDIVATLDFLEDLNTTNDSQYYDRLDLTKIGLLGHSTGGGGGTAVALLDDRIDAIIGLDSWVEPLNETELENILSIPSLFFRSGSWEQGLNNEDLYQIINDSTSSSTLYQIDGTTHYDFSMAYMISPLTKPLGLTGEIDGRDLAGMLREMIAAFFDDTLNNGGNGDIDVSEWDDIWEVPTTE